MNFQTRNLPQSWDRQSTNGGELYVKLPVSGRAPNQNDPPVSGLTAAEVQVFDEPGGTLRFAAVTCTVDGETGLIQWSIDNAHVSSATWQRSYMKLIATIGGKPYVLLDGVVTLKP